MIKLIFLPVKVHEVVLKEEHMNCKEFYDLVLQLQIEIQV